MTTLIVKRIARRARGEFNRRCFVKCPLCYSNLYSCQYHLKGSPGTFNVFNKPQLKCNLHFFWKIYHLSTKVTVGKCYLLYYVEQRGQMDWCAFYQMYFSLLILHSCWLMCSYGQRKQLIPLFQKGVIKIPYICFK